MDFLLLGVPLVPVLAAPWAAASQRASWRVALGACAVVVAALLPLAQAAFAGAPASAGLGWFPALGVGYRLRADGLGTLFALLVAGVGVLIVLYARAYLEGEGRVPAFFAYLLLFTGAMLGLVLADDLLTLYVFWEGTSLASFFLIGFHDERWEARQASVRALVVTVLGGLSMLAGFVLLGLEAGTFRLSELDPQAVRASPRYPWVLGLVLAGAFTKSAQLPVHFWLPGAMVAPTPVSAYLHSATMVKAGVFLLLRLLPVLGGTELWRAWVQPVGLATFLFGAAVAVLQDDLKALLAYGTVSALGLATALAGSGTEVGRDAAVLYLLNHAAYKGSLFLVAGAVEHETGSRSIRRLRGLGRTMPATAAVASAGVFSLAALPGSGGFVAKDLAAKALGHELEVWLWAGAVATAAFGLRFLGVFFGRPEVSGRHEPAGLWAPALPLAALCLLFGTWRTLPEGVVAGLGAVHNVWPAFSPGKLAAAVAAVAAGAGVGWVASTSRWRWPEARWNGERVFDALQAALLRSAEALTHLTLTGRLRDYLVVVLGVAAVGAGLPLVAHARWLEVGRVGFEAAFVAIGAGAVLVTVLSRSLVAAVVSLGAVGYSVVFLFMGLRAPDLALTQMLVETVTLVLFLAVVTHMLAPDVPDRHPLAAVDLAAAVLVGVVAAGLAYQAAAGPPSPRLAEFFAHNAHRAGGTNLVNLVVVDFRGLDTLGEITVLGIAALGVLALARRPR
jgi:NADH:ubiquinone oxidoreductase subunit 5 (subunit L)/multisubunit Na+/H+ antiporter MnhA subunit